MGGNTAAADFNAWLATRLATLQDLYADRHIAFFQIDVYASTGLPRRPLISR
jgi:hypothetical protein